MKASAHKISASTAFFRVCLWLLVLVVLPGMLSRPASAQQATPSDNDVNAVAKQMYCPVCENIPLDVCPTQACAQWRELIRQKLGEGWSEQQIKDYFVAQYGDRVLAEPPRTGLNWLVYVLPAVFFIGGVTIVVWVLRKMRVAKKPVSPLPPPQVVDDPFLTRLEDELHKRDNI